MILFFLDIDADRNGVVPSHGCWTHFQGLELDLIKDITNFQSQNSWFVPQRKDQALVNCHNNSFIHNMLDIARVYPRAYKWQQSYAYVFPNLQRNRLGHLISRGNKLVVAQNNMPKRSSSKMRFRLIAWEFLAFIMIVLTPSDGM